MRLIQLNTWLQKINTKAKGYNFDFNSLQPASSDASFRRYFRIKGNNNTYIIMDAPPEYEDCTDFIQIAQLFSECNINVPKVLEIELAGGFLLLSDLGSTTYLQALYNEKVNSAADNYSKFANQIYSEAIESLLKIQLNNQNNILPHYDDKKLLQEMQLFNEWYIPRQCNTNLTDNEKNQLNNIYSILIKNNTAQLQVYVHRDYHCRNLMYTKNNNPGVLDFQDALYGPVTYDLVSLLRDAYIQWEEEQQIDWLVRYWQKAKIQGLVLPSFDDFYIDYELMGLQRHLKVLGIFARLFHRDNKDAYLKDIPLVLKYTYNVVRRYGEFTPLLRILDKIHNNNPNSGYTF